ncbi:MAG: ATP-binding cassette domain-containing protein, partial [Actinobacteria bacterium]|nr:ATP-binding cassette domain-containing protein [Actinomycetota bacterium]
MNTPKISLTGVTKSYAEHQVLKGITLDIAEGSVVTLIGPSGSGKSTLLRCVNLLEPIDDGTILLDGVDISIPGFDANPVRRRVGMVFQNFNLFPHMSVIDNITLSPIRTLGVDKALAKAKAHDLLERFG